MTLNFFFTNIATWLSQTLFFLGLLPQIRLNYKLKTTNGLSDLMLIGYLNGYMATLFYVFSLNLPMSFRIMVPASFVAICTMFFQRFYYLDKWEKKDYTFFRICLFNILSALVLLIFVLKDSGFFGYFCGWLMMFIWATYQIPQIIKIFRGKATQGFSFLLVSLVGLGDTLEFSAAIILGLPAPSYVNNFRGIFAYLIFSLQFWLYSKKRVNKIE